MAANKLLLIEATKSCYPTYFISLRICDNSSIPLCFDTPLQVQDLTEESAVLQSESRGVLVAQRENTEVREAAAAAAGRARQLEEENAGLLDKLQRQEVLYTELKKMRGRDEELEYMQEMQQVREK